MAVLTRRPGGAWVSVGRATDYANVVANYASILKQAQQVQSDVELEGKVFQYKNGQLTYSDLKSYLNTRLTSELPGSQRELDLRKLLTEAGDFENKKNKDIERSKLEIKFAANGISAAERVQIENDLLQYFKEGTSEYTEQLSTIAAAKDLQRQEDRASKLANLEGKLSEGGLSTSEKIEIYEQAKGLTERGSKEYGDMQAKVGSLKQVQKEEEMAQKRNDLAVKLLDQYKEGGLENEELLAINKEMQRLAVPGSDDAVSLKEAEAKLLGAIADEARAGAGKGKKEQEDFAGIELQRLDAERQDLENKFEIGAIGQEEYMSQYNRILADQNDTLEGVPGANVGAEFQGELLNRVNELTQLNNAVKTGQAVVVKTAQNKQQIIPLSELGGYMETVTTAAADAFDEGGNIDPSKFTEENVVRLVVNGKERTFVVNESGDLEQAREEEFAVEGGGKQKVYVKTGVTMDTKPRETQKGFSTPTPTPSPVSSLGTNFSSASTGGAITVPRPTSSGTTKKSSSTVSSKTSGTGATINFAPVAQKTISTIQNRISPSRSGQSGIQVGPVKVTKGAFGTPDFGITEKLGIGTKLKAAASKVKSALSNIFK